MLELHHVTKTYYASAFDRTGFSALKDISFSLPRGELIGLLGANGAGKTTLMKCILGLIPTTNGQILLDGQPIRKNTYSHVSFGTCEHSFFPEYTASEHLRIYKKLFPKFNEERFAILMEFFQFTYQCPIRAYSMGQQNQFETMLALCQGADYILLDEPFASNDVFNREDFYKLLLGMLTPSETILLSTHLIDEIKHVLGRVLLLQKGSLLGDITLDELEDQNLALDTWIRQQYQHSTDRILQAIERGYGL